MSIGPGARASGPLHFWSPPVLAPHDQHLFDPSLRRLRRRGIDPSTLQRCLAQLDDPKRDCIVFAFVEGYTHEQIAQRLTTPVGTVKSWIRRGLLALKECLS